MGIVCRSHCQCRDPVSTVSRRLPPLGPRIIPESVVLRHPWPVCKSLNTFPPPLVHVIMLYYSGRTPFTSDALIRDQLTRYSTRVALFSINTRARRRPGLWGPGLFLRSFLSGFALLLVSRLFEVEDEGSVELRDVGVRLFSCLRNLLFMS